MNTDFNNSGSQNNSGNFSNDNSNQQSQHQNEQPTTPFQTPVSDSTEKINNQNFSTTNKTYNTYDQWQMHNAVDMKKKQSKTNKKCAIVIGCFIAASAIFTSGIFFGSKILGPIPENTIKNEKLNIPTLNISNTPKDSSSAISGESLNGKQIFDKVNPSIVAIQCIDTMGQLISSGSGVIMSEDGYIITNAHVITDENTNQPAQSISVLFSDGSQIMAKVIGTDKQTDLAVIKVNPNKKLVAAEFGNSDSLQVGEDAYAIGSPGGIELVNTMTNGIISAINRDITVNDRVMNLIQTNVTINPGNSGGALINQYGQVIGITSAKLGISYYEGLGFAIPINSAKEIVDELISNGYIAGRPAIGISGRDITQQMAQFRNLPVGVQIHSIDSRAKSASEGLVIGDIITAVNKQTITTMDEINKIKENMKAGDKLTLTIYRPSQQKTMDITITLTDAHDLEGIDPATQQENNNPNNYRYNNPFEYFFGR